jgi:hypothetical protein
MIFFMINQIILKKIDTRTVYHCTTQMNQFFFPEKAVGGEPAHHPK